MKTITLPVDGNKIPFAFDKSAAEDKEMDKILQSLVKDLGSMRRKSAPVSTSQETPFNLCLNKQEARVISQLSHDIQMNPSLNSEQARFLTSWFLSTLSLERSSPHTRMDLNGLGAQVVRKINHQGFSYLLLMPDNTDGVGEVLYYSNISNSAGVDWLDFVFELLVGVIGLMFAISAAGGMLQRLARALRRSDMFDRLKALLKSDRFRELLKKLAELIPGVDNSVKILEVLKELIEMLWEGVIKAGLNDIKKALGGILSLWSLLLAGLGWLMRFLSGGTAILAELGLLLATLGLKVLNTDDERA